MTLHDAFEKVFILTLPGAEERRAVLEGHLREVGIVDLSRVTWVRAVAGSVCPPPIWFRAGEGAWGCFCSHLRMAQDAAMDGVESYFVIEDDAIFRADACERLGRVMAELPGDWGQLYLGGEHLREPVALTGAVMRAGNINRTHAYAVHRRARLRVAGGPLWAEANSRSAALVPCSRFDLSLRGAGGRHLKNPSIQPWKPYERIQNQMVPGGRLPPGLQLRLRLPV